MRQVRQIQTNPESHIPEAEWGMGSGAWPEQGAIGATLTNTAVPGNVYSAF